MTAITTALVALAAHAPIATADGGSATSLPAVAGTVGTTDDAAKERTSARPSASEAAAERRCRSTARRRLARVRRASLTKRERTTARKRLRRKLRRCLSAARRVVPAPTPGGPGPGPAQPPPTTPTGPTPPAPTLPSFVGVTASDSDGFRLALSRPAVAAGNVTIELRNTDRGPHDLVVEPDGGGAETARFDPLAPDSAPTRKTVALPAGLWRLYCSLSNHAEQGMEVTLRAE